MPKSPTLDEFLALPDAEKAKRFDAMARATFSHVDGRDLLDELHPHLVVCEAADEIERLRGIIRELRAVHGSMGDLFASTRDEIQ